MAERRRRLSAPIGESKVWAQLRNASHPPPPARSHMLRLVEETWVCLGPRWPGIRYSGCSWVCSIVMKKRPAGSCYTSKLTLMVD